MRDDRRERTVERNRGRWPESRIDDLGATRGSSPGGRAGGRPRCRLPSLVTAHGPVIMLDRGAGWTAEVEIRESTYLLATVEGDPHPDVLVPLPFAITSPVWVEIDGRPVYVEEDVRWCLRWLDELERVVGEHGRFEAPARRSDVMRTIDRARSWYRARPDS